VKEDTESVEDGGIKTGGGRNSNSSGRAGPFLSIFPSQGRPSGNWRSSCSHRARSGSWAPCRERQGHFPLALCCRGTYHPIVQSVPLPTAPSRPHSQNKHEEGSSLFAPIRATHRQQRPCGLSRANETSRKPRGRRGKKYQALQVFCRVTILFSTPLARPYSQPFSRTFYSKRGVLPDHSVSESLKKTASPRSLLLRGRGGEKETMARLFKIAITRIPAPCSGQPKEWKGVASARSGHPIFLGTNQDAGLRVTGSREK
jgi:hypothetical protein